MSCLWMIVTATRVEAEPIGVRLPPRFVPKKARDGPALDVPGEGEEQPERGCKGIVEGEERVPRTAREERAGPGVAEAEPCEAVR